jgi:hypothetical protein
VHRAVTNPGSKALCDRDPAKTVKIETMYHHGILKDLKGLLRTPHSQLGKTRPTKGPEGIV